MQETFYTSVASQGNKILVRGYRDGQQIQERVSFEPSLFLETEQDTGITDNRKSVNLREKKFSDVFEMKQFIKSMAGVHGFRYYGTENIIRQYISENYRGEIHWSPETAKIWVFDIETTVGEGIAYHEVETFNKKERLSTENCLRVESGEYVLVEAIDDTDKVWDYQRLEFVPFRQSCYASKGFPTPEYAYEEITLLSFYSYNDNKGYIFSTLPVKESNRAIAEGADYKFYEDEASMLKDVVIFFRTHWIDILSGWNSEFFDVPYTVNRIKRVLGDHSANLLSPWNTLIQSKTKVNDKEVVKYDIVGICHLDYLELYKKFNPGSQESFKLDYIADLELGSGKVENPYETFKEFYQKDPNLFVEYNWRDTTLLRDLEKKMQLIVLAMMIAFMSRVNIEDVHSSMRVWESEIYNHFRNNNQYLWANAPRKIPRKIPGAFVMDPKPGKYVWVVSLDFTSLYPSIMMQNNISPDTKYMKLDVTPEDILSGNIPEFDSSRYILSGNGVLCRRGELGYIPYLVKQKFDQRKAFKKQMLGFETEAQAIRDQIAADPDKDWTSQKERLEYLEPMVRSLDVKQKAVKVLANALYGISANEHFSGYDPDLGEAITLTGQVALRYSAKVIDEFMNTVCESKNIRFAYYGDTDSCYIEFDLFVQKYCANMDQHQIVDYIEKFVFDVLQKKINKSLADLMLRLGAEKSYLDQKLECIGPACVQVAKKRYAFDILYSEGVRYENPKMKVMGMEIVRSSTPSVIKDQLKKGVKLVLEKNEESLQSYIAEVKKTFMSLPYYEIAFPRGCNGLATYSDPTTIYRQGCPKHVRAALLYNHHLKKMGLESKYPLIGEGDKIKFIALKKPNPFHEDVIGFPVRIPDEFGLTKYINFEEQFQKAFMAPLESVLESVNWSAEPKVNLEDFF